jgi:RNA polymerase sigma-32 factor
MASIPTVPVISSESNLSRYLQEIRKFPMLSPDEEFMLGKSWREHGDIDAAHKLVTSHLRLVAKIAMGYRGYGLPLSELISEGNVGMMQAVKRFDPDRRLKGQMRAIDDGDLSPEQVNKIATTLDVPEADVISMNRRLGSPDHSLNAPLRQDSDSGEWQDWLVDESDNQEIRLAESEELGQRKSLLSDAMTTLNDRERRILTARRLQDEPITLEDLSQEYGISRERVRQIEVRAFEKLQKSIKSAAVKQKIDA